MWWYSMPSVAHSHQAGIIRQDEPWRALLDGWVEGPTWAAPLNSRQLNALLLVMHAARKYCNKGLFECSVVDIMR
jgi:hypothetical protein